MTLLSFSSLAFASTLFTFANAGGIVTPDVFAQQNFDFVIIGGGTAGVTLASRLTENEGFVVGVIEAGLNLPDDPVIYTPQRYGQPRGNPMYDWAFVTSPQAALGNRGVALPRGKLLGGSSAINYMGYNRASSIEYDGWSTFSSGAWSWKNLLPYFLKAENVTSPRVPTPFDDPTHLDPTYEGVGGPTQVSYNEWYSNITGPYTTALNDLNIKYNPMPDTGHNTGSTNSKTSVDRKTGHRSYAATTYHVLAQSRPNYFVTLSSMVSQIVFQSQTTTPSANASNNTLVASSVKFTSNGTTYTANVGSEVIVSAGTYQTPQILELSGIGNQTLLQSLGIPVLYNLPGVGESLQDHGGVPNSFALTPDYLTFDILRNNLTYAAQAAAEYKANGTGIYASTFSAWAFVALNDFLNSTDVSSLQQLFATQRQVGGLTEFRKKQYEIQAQNLQNNGVSQVEIIMNPLHTVPTAAAANTSYLTITMANLHPFARGHVHINSTSPSSYPIIDQNYISNDYDKLLMRKAVQFARKITQTGPLASAASLDVPSASVQTDADFDTWVQQSLLSVAHPIGTSAMAPESWGGVVNPNLRLYGTSNVRVVDASIMPMHLSAHMQQTVYAIAEKAALIICRSYPQKCKN